MPLSPRAKIALFGAACTACIGMITEDVLTNGASTKVQNFVFTTVCGACMGIGAFGVTLGVNNLRRPADQN